MMISMRMIVQLNQHTKNHSKYKFSFIKQWKQFLLVQGFQSRLSPHLFDQENQDSLNIRSKMIFLCLSCFASLLFIQSSCIHTLDIIILMVQIRLQNDELILDKLCKLKCSQGCQNCANYIVYEMGLYCTGCLYKLQEVPKTHLATLEELSRIIAEMTENYKNSVKNGSNLLVLKAEAQTQGKVIKSLRDALTIDVKSVFSKVDSLTVNAQNSCTKQYKNEPLEDFFQPNLTTSVLLNDSELFVNNLHNLKVVCDGKKVSYQFQESQKNPEAAKTKALRQIDQTGNALNNAQNRMRNIMERFRDAVKDN